MSSVDILVYVLGSKIFFSTIDLVQLVSRRHQAAFFSPSELTIDRITFEYCCVSNLVFILQGYMILSIAPINTGVGYQRATHLRRAVT